MQYVKTLELTKSKIMNYHNAKPFRHLIIDNFFTEKTAKKLCRSFPDYNEDIWHIYNNAIENKKTINNWNIFNDIQYNIFTEMNSSEFVNSLSKLCGCNIIADPGLHGAGLHIHGDGGNLNPHLDYSLHPKTKLQRKINIIVYIEEDYKESFGGQLGFWQHCSKSKIYGKLIKEITPAFNRCVIFDTTQNSWHGMSKPLRLPSGKYRKSIAMYYMQKPATNVETRSRALFAPRKDQMNDSKVLSLIEKRSNEATVSEVYEDH